MKIYSANPTDQVRAAQPADPLGFATSKDPVKGTFPDLSKSYQESAARVFRITNIRANASMFSGTAVATVQAGFNAIRNVRS